MCNLQHRYTPQYVQPSLTLDALYHSVTDKYAMRKGTKTISTCKNGSVTV